MLMASLLAGVGLLVAAPAALAHDDLVSVSPADGTTLSGAPTQVVLVFSDDVQPVGTAVVVRGSDGAEVGDGPAQVDGTTVTQPLRPLTADGSYQVSYRVVSSDGHPTSGTTSFTLQGVGPTLSPTPPGPEPETGSGSMSWALLVGALVVVGVAVVILLRVSRRSRA